MVGLEVKVVQQLGEVPIRHQVTDDLLVGVVPQLLNPLDFCSLDRFFPFLSFSLTVRVAFTTQSLRAHFSFPTRSSVSTKMVCRYLTLHLLLLCTTLGLCCWQISWMAGSPAPPAIPAKRRSSISQIATVVDFAAGERDLDLGLCPGIVVRAACGGSRALYDPAPLPCEARKMLFARA